MFQFLAGHKAPWFYKLQGTDCSKLIKRSRSSPLEVVSGKGVLKICSKFTGVHSCRSMICCIFSEHLFLRTVLERCFWTWRCSVLKFLKMAFGRAAMVLIYLITNIYLFIFCIISFFWFTENLSGTSLLNCDLL